MLRIYFLQQWFSLSDPAVEEALYDSLLMRHFARIDLGSEPVPDETTVCKFRHLLEKHSLGGAILEAVNVHLGEPWDEDQHRHHRGCDDHSRADVDQERERERDPEMHQTKKGNQWYFGMKAHVGVDSETKIIHSAVVTAANIADSAVLPDLLHGEETESGAIRLIADRARRSMKPRHERRT